MRFALRCNSREAHVDTRRNGFWDEKPRPFVCKEGPRLCRTGYECGGTN